MDKKKRFDKICSDIKSIKIQGSRNIAKAGLVAYKILPSLESKKKIASLRPTEPLLINVLKNADNLNSQRLDFHLKATQEIINKEVLNLIKKKSVIFTHCHSSTVIEALINAKKKKKKFEVYNTETRPLFQGRLTLRDLQKAKIKITMFIDSAAAIALTSSQSTKKVDLVLLGSDAITNNGAVNKVGSGIIAQIAKLNNIPVYILTDSWKYANKIKLEQRFFGEVWNVKHVMIKNPAFEFIPKQNISGIISEFGLLSYGNFLKKVKN